MTPQILPGMYFVIKYNPKEINESLKEIIMLCCLNIMCQLITCTKIDKIENANDNKKNS